jgi:hypothetical protein
MSEFQNKWSILIFLINVYNFFTVFYFLGIEGFPSGSWMHLEIFAEIILIADVSVRLILANTEIWKRFWMLDEAIPLSVLALSSAPLTIVFKASESALNINAHWVAYVKLVKLLRYPQISTFFRNQEFLHKNMNTGIIQVVELFLNLMLITHFSAMLWLAVVRHEINDGGADDTWYDAWRMKDA